MKHFVYYSSNSMLLYDLVMLQPRIEISFIEFELVNINQALTFNKMARIDNITPIRHPIHATLTFLLTDSIKTSNLISDLKEPIPKGTCSILGTIMIVAIFQNQIL